MTPSANPAACKYCTPPSQPRAHDMPFVQGLRCSELFLFPDQTHFGRAVVALDSHHTELFQLSASKLAAFMADVADVAAVIQQISRCDKVNYASYGDVFSHLHMHVVPKHREDFDWGRPFDLESRSPRLLDPAQRDALVDRFRDGLALRLQASASARR